MHKPAPAEHPIHELLRERWSPRAFAPRGLDPGTLRSLFEAARWAPSSSNEQPWRFVVAQRDETEGFQRLLACLARSNQRWAAQASVLVLLVARTHFERTGSPNRHAFHDVGLALAHLLLEATSRGLATHPLAGFDVEAARAALAIPADFEPVVVVAVGSPGEVADLPEDLRARETAPRLRRPLAELVHAGAWGLPAPFLATPDRAPDPPPDRTTGDRT